SNGIVTHSIFLKEAVARVAGCPVVAIPLAYAIEPNGPKLTRAEMNVPDDRILAVSVGHINENKRINVVLQALAEERELARTLVYVVAGDADSPFGRSLLELRDQWDLQETVRFTGYASDTVLRSLLMHADLCINLRYPAMEGSSASCVEQMLYGKPV